MTDSFGIQSGSFGAEQDYRKGGERMDGSGGFPRRDHGLGEAVFANYGRIDMAAIRYGIRHRIEQCGIFDDAIGTRRCRERGIIRPAIARRTICMSSSPKFSIAPAALPIFSPSCRRTRMIFGGGAAAVFTPRTDP